MKFRNVALVLASAGVLGACGGEEEVADGEAIGAGEAEVVEAPAAAPVGAGHAGAFDPVLDVNRNGALDADEGMSDADGDGVLDRDEAYPAVD